MADVETTVRTIALQMATRGPGFAQTGPVVAEAMSQLGIGAGQTEREQEILTAFHDLFRSGDLSWGYNQDNPGAPFFHLPRR